jgi:hypothetical protein
MTKKRAVDAPNPTEVLLALMEVGGSPEATDLLVQLRHSVAEGMPVEPWISAVQTLRDLGTMGADHAFWLIAILSEDAVASIIDDDPRLSELSRRMRDVRRNEGLGDDEDYFVGQGPPEWEQANKDWNRRFDQLHVDLLRRCGEPEMARLMVLRRDEYDARTERGRLAGGGEPI